MFYDEYASPLNLNLTPISILDECNDAIALINFLFVPNFRNLTILISLISLLHTPRLCDTISSTPAQFHTIVDYPLPLFN